MKIEMDLETAYLFSVALIVLMKIVCFLFGFLTVLLGYMLVVAGVEGKFKFSAEWKGLKADLRSVSPGLLFVLLGVWLIGFAILVDKPVELKPYVLSGNSTIKGDPEIEPTIRPVEEYITDITDNAEGQQDELQK